MHIHTVNIEQQEGTCLGLHYLDPSQMPLYILMQAQKREVLNIAKHSCRDNSSLRGHLQIKGFPALLTGLAAMTVRSWSPSDVSHWSSPEKVIKSQRKRTLAAGLYVY